MSITARDIQEQGFEHSRKGYDIEEVDIFLERVATEVDALSRQNQELRTRLAEVSSQQNDFLAAEESGISQEQIQAYETKIHSCEAQIADLTLQLSQKNEDANTISAAFISAQKSADAIREEARAEGEKIYREAEAKAREIVRDALADKQQTLTELEQLKRSRDEFRTEYQSLLSRFTQEAETEFASLPTKTNGPMDKAEVYAQEKAVIAEVRNAAAAQNVKPAAAEPVQQVMPMSIPAKKAVQAPAAATTRMPAVSGDTASFEAFGDTADFDIDEID